MTRHLVYGRALAASGRVSQDVAEVLTLEDGLLVVVADGAGGISGGRAAAEAVVAAVRALVAAGGHLDPDRLVRHLRSVDDELVTHAAGETTAVVAVVTNDVVAGASVGDSEAWIVTASEVHDLTCDQDRRRLGSGRADPVVFGRVLPDAKLIVGTDGLFKYLPRKVIAGIVRDLETQAAADELVRRVRLPSGTLVDDVAVIVVDHDDAAT